MQPQIGKIYRLKVPKDVLDEPITWAYGRNNPKYVTLRDVSGKIVEVRTSSRLLVKYFLVSVIDAPDFRFFVTKDFFEEIDNGNSIKCTCAIGLLMNKGCQCGAFKKEKRK